jgi:hypothetical protein
VCVGLVKGFIGVRWRGFRVMTLVDLGLTGLTRLIRSLALMTVIKNLGRHKHSGMFTCRRVSTPLEHPGRDQGGGEVKTAATVLTLGR